MRSFSRLLIALLFGLHASGIRPLGGSVGVFFPFIKRVRERNVNLPLLFCRLVLGDFFIKTPILACSTQIYTGMHRTFHPSPTTFPLFPQSYTYSSPQQP